jgi:anti-sigma regulatory factor (Ser/Thr protein kinase)
MPSAPVFDTQTYPARFESLEAICEFVTRAALQAELDDAATYAVQTAVDEACSNIVEHAYANQSEGDIQCVCSVQPGMLTVTLRDQGRPFDPSQILAPDLNAGLEDRPIGGLGIYFMRRLMDSVTFEFVPGPVGQAGFNVLTMVKRSEPAP